jgi:hypothetical protein
VDKSVNQSGAIQLSSRRQRGFLTLHESCAIFQVSVFMEILPSRAVFRQHTKRSLATRLSSRISVNKPSAQLGFVKPFWSGKLTS